MTEIKIKKGLDIPIKGQPQGNVSSLISPHQVSLNLAPFPEIKFRLLAKANDVVKIGQPIAEDKSVEGRMFVSPASGVIKEIRRGAKRRLMDIVIEVQEEEQYQENSSTNFLTATPEEILEKLKRGGYFAHIRKRPFNFLANPDKKPRNIFVKALESAPLTPPAEMQVEGHEEDFQAGLTALSKLTEGKVHLVYRKETTCRAFLDAKDVEKHTAEGPHPISHYSLHIQRIDPIRSYEDVVWTVSAHDVVGIGYFLRTGKYYLEKVISIAGPGILPGQTGYFRVRRGYPIGGLIPGKIEKGMLRLISGNPLTGRKVETEDFLGFYDYVFCVIPENVKREFLHFFRLGLKKYSFSKAYWSGHLNNHNREYHFTTNLHGEKRAFIDPTLYDEVMPLDINTMILVKAIMAEDFEYAEGLGLLDVDGEDFDLPSFVCPSKIDMITIVNNGLKQYAAEVLG